MVQRLQNAGDAYIISKQTNLRIYQLFDRGKGKGGGKSSNTCCSVLGLDFWQPANGRHRRRTVALQIPVALKLSKKGGKGGDMNENVGFMDKSSGLHTFESSIAYITRRSPALILSFRAVT